MKAKTPLAILVATGSLFASMQPAIAQGSAFTYQGRLNVGTNVANGIYDFQFVLSNAPSGGDQVGVTVTQTGIGVTNGLFVSVLDFGSVFTNYPTWLAISVRTNGVGGYIGLKPLQQLTPTPYAIYSENAATLGGQAGTAYVAKAGDAMTGTLNLPANGLKLAGNQLVASGGNIGIGTAFPSDLMEIYGTSTSKGIRLNDGTFFHKIAQRGDTLDLSANVGASGSAGDIRFNIRGATNTKMIIDKDGNVGIGTPAPSTALDVNGTVKSTYSQISDGSPTLEFFSPGSEAFQLKQEGTSINGASRFSVIESASGLRYLMSILWNGNVGIGTNTPAAKLDVVDTQSHVRLLSTANTLGSVLELGNTTLGGTTFGSINFTEAANPALNDKIVAGEGFISFNIGGNNSMTVGGGGYVTVGVLQINGADVAEPFDLSTKDIPKGSVVVIDEANPGQVKLSNRVYDKRVAGILSGANGVNSGILLKQQGFNDGGQNVALSGRVYALADASNGDIHPGDLLTTSGTPGHCMKVTNDAKAQGAIIGKAMSSLEKGKGMVLVLVTLQ